MNKSIRLDELMTVEAAYIEFGFITEEGDLVTATIDYPSELTVGTVMGEKFHEQNAQLTATFEGRPQLELVATIDLEDEDE